MKEYFSHRSHWMITQRFLAGLKMTRVCFTFMDLLILFFLKENYKMTSEITPVKIRIYYWWQTTRKTISTPGWDVLVDAVSNQWNVRRYIGFWSCIVVTISPCASPKQCSVVSRSLGNALLKGIGSREFSFFLLPNGNALKDTNAWKSICKISLELISFGMGKCLFE